MAMNHQDDSFNVKEKNPVKEVSGLLSRQSS